MENHSFIKFVPGVYLIYLSVPKVASSSISHAMLMNQPTAFPGMSEHSPEGKALTNWRSATAPQPAMPIFTFTRHPINKFISYYKDKFVRARGKGFELDHLRKLNFDPEMSLEEMVRHMMTIPVEKMEHHAQPQHRILVKDGKLIPDFVGKVENFADEWPIIKTLSLSGFSVDHKKNMTEGIDESLTLDDSVLAALTEYYSTDFELFGYDKPSFEPSSINVMKQKYPLTEVQIDRIKKQISAGREAFIQRVEDLQKENFREQYLNSMKTEFNRFLIHANKSSRKQESAAPRYARKLKRMVSG